jgi:hypothetical protein
LLFCTCLLVIEKSILAAMTYVASNENNAEVSVQLAEVFDVRAATVQWQINGARPAAATGSNVTVRVATQDLRPFGLLRVDITARATDVEFDALKSPLPAAVIASRQVVFRMLSQVKH